LTNPGQAPHRIAVLGGGIAGLAAAYTLARARQRGAPIGEFVIEASDGLGGVIRTEQVQGFLVEGGPDSFLTEKPEAAALCRELGLGDSLLGSNDTLRRTYILHRGRLVPLPEGFQLFIPARLWPVITTPLLTPRGKLAAATERFRGRGRPSGNTVADESAADFVRRHFGSEVLENIADPLLAGVFGGDSKILSARSALPRLWEMERTYGSLIRGMLEARKQRSARKSQAGASVPALGRDSPPVAPPLFMTLKGGLAQIVGELKKHLANSRLNLGQRAVAVERAGLGVGKGYRIRCAVGAADSVAHEADAIILALPASECGRLLSSLDSALAESLQAIPYSSALTVALGYDAEVFQQLPMGFGFLVPQKERRRLLACTFVHNKFAHRAPPGKALLRCFLGGSRDPEAVNLADDEIISTVRRELREVLNLSQEPLFCRIYRWPSSMPQYAVGHQEVLNKIDAQLKRHPGLFLAGNAYSGVGMSDSIRTARTAAEQALSLFGTAEIAP
jgi:protoporphyrinogen/coproporphyrinogen III oxidase